MSGPQAPPLAAKDSPPAANYQDGRLVWIFFNPLVRSQDTDSNGTEAGRLEFEMEEESKQVSSNHVYKPRSSTYFRGEDVMLCQIYLQPEAMFTFVKMIGEMAIFQFKDMMPDVNLFQRKFVTEVRRCEEMERQIRYFEREIAKEDVKIIKRDDSNFEAFNPTNLIDMEAVLEKQEETLKSISDNIDTMKLDYFELTELKNVLTHAVELFSCSDDDDTLAAHDAMTVTSETEAPDQDLSQTKFEFIAGVVEQEKIGIFMRMLWFGCRTNVLLRFTDMPDPITDLETGNIIRKVVFVVFFQGKQLETRIKKICGGFRANLYPCPETKHEREEMLSSVLTRIQDMNMVMSKSTEVRIRLLKQLAQDVHSWHIRVKKTKAIFHTMNNFYPQGRHFIAEGWCPVQEKHLVQNALKEASVISESSIPSIIQPLKSSQLPSYHKTNRLTSAYQAIVNAYGVPSYMEMNPAPFSLITFPFLFSVMFGDLGHGLIMMLFAVWMIWNERKFLKHDSDNEIWNIFFGGRYLIFLMGLFSIYAGIIYNDIFSKSANVFGTAWGLPYSESYYRAHEEVVLDPAHNATFPGTPYPFGVDPIWQLSGNKITFSNSYKKKISIIFGILQMYMGIFISLANHIHFKNMLNIVGEFIPQILFLTGIFGYLVGLMIAKWIVVAPAKSGCAPSLLIGLINMFLLSYPKEPCSSKVWYPGQKAVEHTLLAVVAICVPWMLFVKPLYLRHQNNKAKRLQQFVQTQDINGGVDLTCDDLYGESSTDDLAEILPENNTNKHTNKHPHSDTGEEFNFGEVIVHQCIHTIEFCLGCVSHTASYLRLWALSLAHTQLSEVLWTMVFQLGLKMNGYLGCIMIFMLFIPWAFLTVAILLMMEGLSAFLHTLRLHWVEFQSKFYKGEGIKFEPFDFHEILKNKEDTSKPKSSQHVYH